MAAELRVFTIKDFVEAINSFDSSISSEEISTFLTNKGHKISKNSVRALKAHINR